MLKCLKPLLCLSPVLARPVLFFFFCEVLSVWGGMPALSKSSLCGIIILAGVAIFEDTRCAGPGDRCKSVFILIGERSGLGCSRGLPSTRARGVITLLCILGGSMGGMARAGGALSDKSAKSGSRICTGCSSPSLTMPMSVAKSMSPALATSLRRSSSKLTPLRYRLLVRSMPGQSGSSQLCPRPVLVRPTQHAPLHAFRKSP
mmetsp:Transcript_302/g.1008  ORF Transcript_302/g.1008 Transcript_302/m.1008 type:complete len:203 (-) Transcript_302:159-767(-)